MRFMYMLLSNYRQHKIMKIQQTGCVEMIPFSYLEQVVLGSIDPSITTIVKQTLKDTHEWKIMYKKLNNGVKSAQIRSVFFFCLFSSYEADHFINYVL